MRAQLPQDLKNISFLPLSLLLASFFYACTKVEFHYNYGYLAPQSYKEGGIRIPEIYMEDMIEEGYRRISIPANNSMGVTISPFQTFNPGSACYEGEVAYRKLYPDLKQLYGEPFAISGYHHYSESHGKIEGRKYACNFEPSTNMNPHKPCPEGEAIYVDWYKNLFDEWNKTSEAEIKNGYTHWTQVTKKSGGVYFCFLNSTGI